VVAVVVAAVGLVVLLGVVAAAHVAGNRLGDKSTQSPVAPAGAPQFSPAVRYVPPLQGADMITGDSVTLHPTGRPLLVVFWAHWCPHCQVEMPRIEEMYDQDGGDKYDIITVATFVRRGIGADGYSTPEDFVQSAGLTMPVILDSTGQIARRWGVDGTPEMFIIEPSGREILADLTGEWPESALAARLEAAARR